MKEWRCYQWHPHLNVLCLPFGISRQRRTRSPVECRDTSTEKAVQEEKTQSQVFKTELAREKDF